MMGAVSLIRTLPEACASAELPHTLETIAALAQLVEQLIRNQACPGQAEG